MAIFTEIFDLIKGAGVSFLQWNITYERAILDQLHLVFDKIFYVFLYMMIGLTMVYLALSLVAIFSKNKNREKKFDMKKAPFVTIQIPTRNELVALRCAEKCLESNYPKGKYEILIGDDSDDPLVSQQIDDFAKEHSQVRVIRRKENIGFKPGNLNNMLRHSKGDILVIFDSDFTPEKDFLKRIVAPFVHDNEVSAVQAKWNFNNSSQNHVTVLASTIVDVFHHVVLSFMEKFNTGSLCGSAEAVKKKDLLKLGGWVSGSLTEDIEYSLRLHKADKRIVYLPFLECYGDVPFKAMDLYKQQMRWAYGVITSYRKHIVGLMTSRTISFRKKMLSLCAGFGYTLPIVICMLFVFGALSFVTDRPGPIDLIRFFSELGINIVLTSGLLFASLASLYKAKRMRHAFSMLLASFSIGLVTTVYVNKGIIKAVMRKPMEWYLLNKNIPSGIRQS